MIAHLKGTLAHKDTKAVVVDVNGIGYLVEVPERTINGLPALSANLLRFISTIAKIVKMK